jgi:hypothetical protein
MCKCANGRTLPALLQSPEHGFLVLHLPFGDADNKKQNDVSSISCSTFVWKPDTAGSGNRPVASSE